MSAAPDDLTGAALVALMRLSFAEQGIALPDDAPSALPNHAHASLAAKSRLAEAVLARHGPRPLLAVGRSIPRMAFDPIGAALLAARDGVDLFKRWARLERYVHMRHPIAFLALETGSARLAHLGDPEDQPSPAMDLVLAGVLAGLLQAIGCRNVVLEMGESGDAMTFIRDGELADIARLPVPSGVWQFSWQAGDVRTTIPAVTAAGAGRIAREAARIIEADLLVPWTLPALAEDLRLSRRTLQRRLAHEGLSVQSLRRTAQIRRAILMLGERKASLSAIGFACGFSDPAHFTRAFRQATGMTPSAYMAALR